MSPIGKIFVILNLFLAAAFLGWASSALATNQNYKSQLETLTLETDADIARLEGQVSEKDRLIGDGNVSIAGGVQTLESVEGALKVGIVADTIVRGGG